MAVVADIVIGAVTYKVYGLTSDAVQDADDYFGARLGATAWTGATTLQKQQALVTSARFLDRGMLWSGKKTSSTQPLQWPRDGAMCRGDAVADGTIPDDIARGEFELALALLEDESIQDSSGSNQKRVKAGSAEVEFFRPTEGDAGRFPVPVQELVACYGAGSATAAGPFADGTDPDNADEATSFDSESNSLGLSEGFA